MEEPATVCLRCAKTIQAGDSRELCWGCEGELCEDCWEDFGVCIAPPCIESQRVFNEGTNEQRMRIAGELFAKGPKRNEH